MAFAFLTKVSHMQVAMVDEINNLHELNAILHRVNIGQRCPLMQQYQPTFQTLFGEGGNRSP